MAWARSSAALSIVLAAITASARDARAEDEPVVPPTVPSLAHRTSHFNYQVLGAGFGAPFSADAGTAFGLVWFVHFGGEYPMVPAKWYFGASVDVAFGVIEGGPPRALYGDPEFWVRGVWTSKGGLEAGGSIGAIVPTASDLNERAAALQRSVEVIRPWDTAYFSRSSLTLRPAFDVAYAFDWFLVQLRQGLDVSYAVDTNEGSISGHTDLLLNVTAANAIDIALEAFETYDLTRDLPDAQRAAFTLGPAVSLRFPKVRPGLSALVPIGTPLGGDARAFFAMRVFATIFL
ncbi:MAG: hypothetical protein U0414_41095 [Polyangiaceae bacterium]